MAEDILGDGYIHVSYDHMDSAAADLESQNAAIRKTIESMEAELRPLRESWYGSDAAAYDAAQRKWDNAIAEAQRVLDRHKILLEGLKHNYGQTEKKLTGLWEHGG
ncbi:WXG100 family type VII secretion target [Streptomyces spinosus]|uniref:WXG100 family type VII secretion target n=1 Tax=Streptomyces spinosus TaxID=2872623 RepID=UPI001CED9B5A|nr:WXG100 family type VII secretion target [Streptomyces spinosus]